jgi:hypothetical protein
MEKLKSCEWCAFWRLQDGIYLGRCRCDAIKHYMEVGSEKFMAVACDAEEYTAWISTKKDFSCSLFEFRNT